MEAGRGCQVNPALSALRHHVSGAIARGEAQAITEVPAPHSPAHTPGPWHLNPRGWVVQSTGDIVTRLECSNNKEADARLIAAAPELLAALEAVLPDLEHYVATHGPGPDKRLAIARAAIARATVGNAS